VTAVARVLFVSWAGGGNQTPVHALDRRLTARGHTVRVIDGMRDPVEPVVRDWRPDAVLVDFMLPLALCDVEATGVRTAALVHTLWQPVADGVVDLVGAFTTVVAINEHRDALGLPRVARAVDLLARVDRVLVTIPRELDRAAQTARADVRYLGPLIDDTTTAWSPPGVPLVAVSLGTTPGLGDEPVLQTVLDAVATLPVHAIANVADHVNRDHLHVPPNASITGYVPHSAVMAHAALLVTHAGLGSVAAAVLSGVPMVCIPLGREQPLNAARVVELGIGRSLAKDATTEEMVAAIHSVITNAQYRSTATALRDAAAPYLRDDVAVSEVEALMNS
jgi:MGT family glycosyltransferase